MRQLSQEELKFCENLIAQGNVEARINTLQVAYEAAHKLPGDFVECGVFAGAHAACMEHSLRGCRYCSYRKIHLFDSFKGIPHPGQKDDLTIIPCLNAPQDGKLETTGISACDVNGVRAFLTSWGCDLEKFIFHDGWFQNTMLIKDNLPKQIALLRLDVDLYESTKTCLEHLYPLVCSGGYVISDDFALTGSREATEEYLKQNKEIPEKIEYVFGTGGTVFWRKN